MRPPRIAPHSTDTPHSAETGSAYIIALLVLVVLTILGLGLALISQTEVTIGANELTTHRVLYGADSGVHQALSRLLTVNSSVESVRLDEDSPTGVAIEPLTVTIPETRVELNDDGTIEPMDPDDVYWEQQVALSPVVPLREHFCDMCPAGEGDVTLVNVNHAMVATAERVPKGAGPPTARKRLYLMVGVQPWWPPRWEAIADDRQTRTVVQETLGAYDEH